MSPGPVWGWRWGQEHAVSPGRLTMQQNGSSFVKYSAFSTEMEIKSQFFVKISDCLALAPCKQTKHSSSKTKYVPRPAWGCGCKQALSGPLHAASAPDLSPGLFPCDLGKKRACAELRAAGERKGGVSPVPGGRCSGLDPGNPSAPSPAWFQGGREVGGGRGALQPQATLPSIRLFL